MRKLNVSMSPMERDGFDKEWLSGLIDDNLENMASNFERDYPGRNNDQFSYGNLRVNILNGRNFMMARLARMYSPNKNISGFALVNMMKGGDNSGKVFVNYDMGYSYIFSIMGHEIGHILGGGPLGVSMINKIMTIARFTNTREEARAYSFEFAWQGSLRELGYSCHIHKPSSDCKPHFKSFEYVNKEIEQGCCPLDLYDRLSNDSERFVELD